MADGSDVGLSTMQPRAWVPFASAYYYYFRWKKIKRNAAWEFPLYTLRALAMKAQDTDVG